MLYISTYSEKSVYFSIKMFVNKGKKNPERMKARRTRTVADTRQNKGFISVHVISTLSRLIFSGIPLCLVCVFQTQEKFSWKETSIQPQAMISESIWSSTLIFDRQWDFQESDLLAAVRDWKFTAQIVASLSSSRHRDTGTTSSESYFLPAWSEGSYV